jgi:hypothetical protein
MSAPLAKGMPALFTMYRLGRCASYPTHILRPSCFYLESTIMPTRREVAQAHTALPGIIIAASVIVAAGIAIYESEQIRIWLDERRRRIAVALHSLGDDINPPPLSEADLRRMQDTNRRRRLDIVRRNRLALIRRAREEGVAVDLDALDALGLDETDQIRSPAVSATSFDDMVGQDGKLRQGKGPEMEQRSTSASSFAPVSDEGLRRRTAGAAAFASDASFGTAFDGDMRMDVDVIGPSSRGFPRTVPINQDSRPQESGIIDNSGFEAMPSHLIDVPVWADVPTETHEQSRYKTDDELEAEIQEAIRRSLTDVPASALQQPEESLLINTSAQLDPFSDVHALQSSLHSSPWTQDLQGLDNSLYALPSPRIEPQSIPILSVDSPSTAPASAASVASFHSATADNNSETARHNGDETPDGMRTPTSATASASAGDTDNDIDEVISIMSGEAIPDDARSEAEMSEFSVIGVSTPGSWTDVDTDGEDEAVNGSTMVQGVAPR